MEYSWLRKRWLSLLRKKQSEWKNFKMILLKFEIFADIDPARLNVATWLWIWHSDSLSPLQTPMTPMTRMTTARCTLTVAVSASSRLAVTNTLFETYYCTSCQWISMSISQLDSRQVSTAKNPVWDIFYGNCSSQPSLTKHILNKYFAVMQSLPESMSTLHKHAWFLAGSLTLQNFFLFSFQYRDV